MSFTDEQLSAYLDGELDLVTENALTDALAESQDLRVRLEELRLADRLVKKAYGPIGDEPMPGAVFDMIDEHFAADPTVVPFPEKKPGRWSNRWQTPLAAALAMAAGLTFGSSVLQTADINEPAFSLMAGDVSVDSPMHVALSTVPSAETSMLGATMLRPILTFATADGQICREVLLSGHGSSSRALGCRTNESWTILATVAEPQTSADGGLFSTATSPASQIFDQTIEALIEGVPMSPTEESEALELATE